MSERHLVDAPLATGTVTLLFTDIEGSTRLWEEEPERMRPALARHDAISRAAVESHQGLVVKSTGDGVYAAFDEVLDALAAAIDLQLALADPVATNGVPLRVRCGLHAGVVERRDNDYFGSPVNRAARIMSAAHGGQVLLSQAVADGVRERFPATLSLRDLGKVRLKDLSTPEHVYQVVHPQLRLEFPALRSLEAIPNNLPQQTTSFIGREKEMAELQRLLAKTRLLTLTGSGGCGKTRLCLQVAADSLEQFPDGAWLVELAPLAAPGLVPQTVASVLGLKEEPGKPILQTLSAHFKDKQLLLLLDNCEHLLDRCAQLADAVLRECPQVTILATSREVLGIGGEQGYRVPSLSLPDLKHAHTPESVAAFGAVQLFTERALLIRADFQVTNENAAALASICCRLDGIPLAIELAAARVRSLSVEEINRKLDQRFGLLTGGLRTALPRQQTLRALIDWSYDLLHEPEKQLLQRLSVFAGGWTLAAAEQICAGDVIADREVLDRLTSLCDKSLVMVEQNDGHTRYRLLETVRQYAQERLLESGGGDAVRQRHRDYFLALAEEAEPKLMGSEQAAWLQHLDEEHENLRAGLDWSVVETGSEGGLRLCGSMHQFWDVRGHFSEGREWCSRVLAKTRPEERTSERAKALDVAGALARRQGDYSAAWALGEESLAIQRQLGDRRGMATSLGNLGTVALRQGEIASARELYEESLAISHELGDRTRIANALGNLGVVAFEKGEIASARSLFEESLAISRELGDKTGVASTRQALGVVACLQGDFASGRAFFQESLAISRELGDRMTISHALHSLGTVARENGDFPAAGALFQESLAISREMGNRLGIAKTLYDLGNVAFELGDYPAARKLFEEGLVIRRELGDRPRIASWLEALAAVVAAFGDSLRAARLWGAAERLREEIGSPLLERSRYDRRVAAARAALKDYAAFDRAWQDGRDATMEQAIELALEKNVEPG